MPNDTGLQITAFMVIAASVAIIFGYYKLRELKGKPKRK